MGGLFGAFAMAGPFVGFGGGACVAVGRGPGCWVEDVEWFSCWVEVGS